MINPLTESSGRVYPAQGSQPPATLAAEIKTVIELTAELTETKAQLAESVELVEESLAYVEDRELPDHPFIVALAKFLAKHPELKGGPNV